jgi:hypothetical protein
VRRRSERSSLGWNCGKGHGVGVGEL